jgi:DnaJ like chaperone protein
MKSFVFLLIIILIGIYTFWNDLSQECIKYGGMNPYTYKVALRKKPSISSKIISNLRAKGFSELKEPKAKWIYYYTLKNNLYIRKKDFILGYVKVCDGYVIEKKLFLTYAKDIYRLLPLMIFIFGIWFLILVLLNKFKRKAKITKQTKQKKEDVNLSKNNSNFTCLDCRRISVNNKFCIYCGEKKVHTSKESLYSKEYIKIRSSKEGILVALLTKVAKANGVITKKEAEFLSQIFNNLCQNSSNSIIRNIFKEIHKKEKDKQNNIEKLCKELLQLNLNTSDKISIISLLIQMAFIEGTYKNEKNIITKVVHFLGIEYTEYEEIIAAYRPKEKNNEHQSNNTKEMSLIKCYEILGCTEKNNIKTIKKRKNELLQEYHPDKQGINISEGMKRIAEEKTQEINAAYAKIKKVRSS